MRVMVMIKATPQSEAGAMPSEDLLVAMGNYNDALLAAGVLKGGEGLPPSGAAVRLRLADGAVTEEAGPFPIPGLVAGFWLWEVASMEEAVAWARRCPHPMPGEEAELELRRVFSAEDFGEAMTPELRAQEDHQRAVLEGKI